MVTTSFGNFIEDVWVIGLALQPDGKILAILLDAERISGKNNEVLVMPGGLASGLYQLMVHTEKGNVVVKIEVQNY